MRQVNARWVPHMLTEDNRQNHMREGLKMLTQYNEKGESFLNRIVTHNETWLHYWTPECKSRSMAWKMADETAQ